MHAGNQELHTGVLTMVGMGRVGRPIAMLSAATHGPTGEGSHRCLRDLGQAAGAED